MRIVNIAPLLMKHKAAMVADLLRLRRDCGVTDVAFMMSLHPERMPLAAKVEALCAHFREMRQALRGSDLRTGILIQSSLSHGDRGGTLTDAGFQQIVSNEGAVSARMCPLDPGFVQYMRDTAAALCRCAPDFLIIDDDYRLTLNAFGCFCPLHLVQFSRRAGGAYTRETLLAVLQRDDAEARRLGALWNEVAQASLVDLSRAIRGAIDAVNPAIPCDYSTYIGEFAFARPIALALAGGTPSCVHVNDAWYLENSWYSSLGYKFAPKRLFHTAMQVAALPGIPEIMAEADTFFHNQHSLSARSLHAEIVGSLLNGVTGVKLWITVMNEHEPAAGEAYRAMLAANHRFYGGLQRLLPGVQWQGPSTPLPAAPVSNWNPVVWEKQARQMNWAGDVCGRLGIPAQVGGPDADVNMLCGHEVDAFTDDELRWFCARGLLLDGAAAELMCRRGFGRELGVDVDPPACRVSGERCGDHPVNGPAAGRNVRVSRGLHRRIIPVDARVEVASRLFLSPWYLSPDGEYIGPGVALFENGLGGRVAIYAESDLAVFMLNGFRREQLAGVLGWLARAPFPMVALGTVDLYVRHGVLAPAQGGGELLCVFNLNQDALPALTLQATGTPVAEITRLAGDGMWVAQPWHPADDGTLVIETPVETMVPLIFRIRRAGDPRRMDLP